VYVDARQITVADEHGAPLATMPTPDTRDGASNAQAMGRLRELFERHARCSGTTGAALLTRRVDALVLQPDAILGVARLAHDAIHGACHGGVHVMGRDRDRIAAFDLPLGNSSSSSGLGVGLGARGFVVTLGTRFVQPGCRSFGGAVVTVPGRPDGAPDVAGLRTCLAAMRADRGVGDWIAQHDVVSLRVAPSRQARDFLAVAAALVGSTGDPRDPPRSVALAPLEGLVERAAEGTAPPEVGPTFPLSPPGTDLVAQAALSEALRGAAACVPAGTSLRVEGTLDPTTARVTHAPIDGPPEAVACVGAALDALSIPAPRPLRLDFVRTLQAPRPTTEVAPSQQPERVDQLVPTLRRLLGDLQRCHEREPAERRRAPAPVHLTATVEADGASAAVLVQSPATLDVWGPCATRVLREARFPAGGVGAVEVALPLTFEPLDEEMAPP